jgi:hypothetical protein
MNLRSVVRSWDFMVAGSALAVAAVTSPARIPNNLAKDLYGLGTSMLAILFSVFFAALAIIMSSSDDEFVGFLEEENGYTKIVATFRFTLLVLFVALMYSLFMYVYTSFRIDASAKYQCKWWLLVFGFLSLYGMFAALASSLDSISYARHRSRFISAKKRVSAIKR